MRRKNHSGERKGSKRRKAPPPSRDKKLNASVAGFFPERVPKRWVKFIVGIFMLPVAWALTLTFFSAFTHTTLRHEFWRTEEFWFFSLGMVLWLVAFFGLPKPLWIYVFGHELTHALCVWIMGGTIKRFRVSARGGHVISDRVNTWIALAPYFFPIYSLLAICLYGFLALFIDVSQYRAVLYCLIGATWGFHFTFTCWMIPKGQSDLAYGGTFFSLVVIYIMNLLVLMGFLIAASPHVTPLSLGKEFLHHASELAEKILLLVQAL